MEAAQSIYIIYRTSIQYFEVILPLDDLSCLEDEPTGKHPVVSFKQTSASTSPFTSDHVFSSLSTFALPEV